MTNELTIVEATSLREHEATIRRHEIGFVAVGLALTAISVGKLYRKTHTSFENYLDEVWGWSKSHAFRQIDAARVYGKLSPIGDGLTLPANESQARPLTGIEMKEVEGVWREVVSVAPLDDAGNPKITAALVQHTVDLHKGDPKPPDKTSKDADIKPVADVCDSCGESDRNDDGDCVSCQGADAYDAEEEIPEDAPCIPADELTDDQIAEAEAMFQKVTKFCDGLGDDIEALIWREFWRKIERYAIVMADDEEPTR